MAKCELDVPGLELTFNRAHYTGDGYCVHVSAEVTSFRRLLWWYVKAELGLEGRELLLVVPRIVWSIIRWNVRMTWQACTLRKN